VILAIGGGLAYAAATLFIAKPLLKRLETAAQQRNGVDGAMLGFILMLLMLGAWFTDYVGIYAVFGAFILGIAMPRGIVSRDLQRLLEPLTTNFLLPLFFIYSGLNTRLDLLFSPSLLLITLLVVIVACFGKGLACWAAARLSGENNREALAIGTLMNARGLMELILLNIGLQHGIITPTLFTIMVIMAVVTTLMASPVFEFVYHRLAKPRIAVALEPVA
jgi:Kef-type K+ transport system membrane component KefB